jgi:hypothetical protein
MNDDQGGADIRAKHIENGRLAPDPCSKHAGDFFEQAQRMLAQEVLCRF